MFSKISGSNILVTGGAGFIGSFLVEDLLKHKPARVLIIDNLLRGSMYNMEAFRDFPNVEYIEGDLLDHDLLDSCVKGMDYVFHLAALRINACAENPRTGFDVMIRGTFELAELCVKHKVKKIVYSSTASVYGLAQNFPTPETDHPYDNQTFYGAAKLWGEQLFRSFKYIYDLDYVALRYFNVYGPRMDREGKYTEVMIKWLDCIRDGKSPVIIGDGLASMDFVFVTDVAKANVAALVSDVSDIAINVGSSVETSLKELLDLLLDVNHSSLVPEFREEKTANPVSRRLADISRANNLLGYKPEVDLRQGLKALSDWYFANQ